MIPKLAIRKLFLCLVIIVAALVVYFQIEHFAISNILSKFATIEATKNLKKGLWPFNFVKDDKPKAERPSRNATIVGLVFYGRKAQFTILQRYLLPNLKINGGILDKIIFAVKTDKKPDLDHLETIMSENHSYFERIFLTNKNFVDFYKFLKDDDLIFKIDDDIVFIGNGTFEKMLEEYIKNNVLILSANVINHSMLSHVHARLKAILPFKIHPQANSTWILDSNSEEIDTTEAKSIKYELGTKWWFSGHCAAIAHESFLHHIANGNLDIYDFKRWDFHSVEYSRWSINFILFKGKYVNKIEGFDDEEAISNHISRKYGKHGYALGSAIVSHFSYFPQISYLLTTNLLEKYSSLSKVYFGNQE
jgi:hypothetical protein